MSEAQIPPPTHVDPPPTSGVVQEFGDLEDIFGTAEEPSEDERELNIPLPVPGPAELSEPVTQKVRSYNDKIALYFGHRTGVEFKSFIYSCDTIMQDMQKFKLVREAFNKNNKTTTGTASRPPFKRIEAKIATLRASNPAVLDASMTDLMDTNLPEDEIFAIVYSSFVQRWFQMSTAPFHSTGIMRSLYLNRVNTLVKLFDNSPIGIIPMNRNRDNKKIVAPRKTRATLEKPAIDKRTPLPSRAEQKRIADDARKDAVTLRTLTALVQKANRENAEQDEDLENERSKGHKKTKRARKNVPNQLTAFVTTRGKGVNIADPSKDNAKQAVTIRQSAYTPDANNPRQTWFFEGYVVGYAPETVVELQQYKECDWICDDDDPEPNFNLGVQAAEAPKTKSVEAQLAALEVESSTVDMEDGVLPDALTPEQQATQAKEDKIARQALNSALKQRVTRLNVLRKVTGFKPGDISKQAEESHDHMDFTRALLKETAFEGIAHTDKKGSSSGTQKGNSAPERHDTNDLNSRAIVKDTSKLMDNEAYQPSNYQHALNVCKVQRRKNPRVPGQRKNGHCNLWWQTTAAAEMYERRTKATRQRLSNLLNLVAEDDPNAEARSRSNVEHGVILGDEVGIGKSNTVALYRKLVRLSSIRGGNPERTTRCPLSNPPLFSLFLLTIYST
jgi:hypothetical protein